MKFPKTKPIRRGITPFGYKRAEDGSKLVAVPEQIKLLQNTIDGVISGKIASLREAKEIIERIKNEDIQIDESGNVIQISPMKAPSEDAP